MSDRISIPAEPRVSLIVPIRNESASIDACLASVVTQDYAADRVEIIVVDGDSTDDTVHRVRSWMRRDPRISLLHNPARLMIPGLNQGLRAASGDLIGYINGHAVLPSDYINRSIASLRKTGAWSVGGQYQGIGRTPQGRANALAMSSPVGVGDARHNYGQEPGWAETAFPGFWPRAVFERVGVFNPEMMVNEDNEFSFRIQRAGGGIWYEPSILIGYVPRDSAAGLFKQYHGYGAGKIAVFRRHPSSIRWRHVVPPAWLMATLGVTALSPWVPPLRAVAGAVLGAYATAVIGGALRATRSGEDVAAWRVCVAFAAMHAGYASGMLKAVLHTLITAIRGTGAHR